MEKRYISVAFTDQLLETCVTRGITVKQQPSGNLRLRMPPAVDSVILVAARAEGKTLNQWQPRC